MLKEKYVRGARMERHLARSAEEENKAGSVPSARNLGEIEKT